MTTKSQQAKQQKKSSNYDSDIKDQFESDTAMEDESEDKMEEFRRDNEKCAREQSEYEEAMR